MTKDEAADKPLAERIDESLDPRAAPTKNTFDRIAKWHALLREAAADLRRIEADNFDLFDQRDRAIKTLVRMNEAFVNAGYPGGDRDVTLANIERALADIAALKKRHRDTLRFLAATARQVVDPIYDRMENRTGLAHDCAAVAGEEVLLEYLETRWQTDRAIRAEREVTRLRQAVADLERQAQTRLRLKPCACADKSKHDNNCPLWDMTWMHNPIAINARKEQQ